MNTLRLDENKRGTDWVVGDIHGCFGALDDALSAVEFDPAKDRLFSVGDLVDRGPESELALNYLDREWFYAVRGNHEQLVINAMADNGSGERIDLHCRNGGHWFYAIDGGLQNEIACALDRLPIAIEIGSRYGIVHGEVFGDMSWPDFFHLLERGNERATLSAMWGRDRIKAMDESRVGGIDAVYIGHSPVEHVSALGNTVYTDTGVCYGWPVTLVRLGDIPKVKPVRLKRAKKDA